MREILGYNLKKFFDTIDPKYKEAEITYANDQYEVWEVSDNIFDLMCKMTQNDFVKIAGDNAWMRSSDGCNLDNYRKGDFTVNGKNMIGWENKPWQDDSLENNNVRSYQSLSEYLCEHVGASTPRNVCACATDLARYNDMSMSDLFKNYEG